MNPCVVARCYDRMGYILFEFSEKSRKSGKEVDVEVQRIKKFLGEMIEIPKLNSNSRELTTTVIILRVAFFTERKRPERSCIPGIPGILQ